MTLFHAGQVVLLLGVVALAVERIRALCYAGAVDAAALRRALVHRMARGDDGTAAALALAARPALAVEPVLALLDPAVAEDDRMTELDDRLVDLEQRAAARLSALRVLATIASATGFLGAAIEIHWVFAGDHGLLRLQAGLVESMGLSRAFLSIALGIATSSVALSTYSQLRARSRATVAEGRRLVASVEDTLARRAGVHE